MYAHVTLSCGCTGDRATVTVLPAYAPVRRFPAKKRTLHWLPRRRSLASLSCRSRQAPLTNAATESQRGNIIPVEITVYEDRSFTFITKTPPASQLIKKAAGVAKGSAVPHTTKVGSLTEAQVREIAETKMPDLNANDLDAASKIIAGTARSMGITVE